jgi:hypothetical protein
MPVVVWTGAEVVVLGGDVGPACPPTADCVLTAPSRSGAALDPIRGTWRELRDAPLDIPPSSAAFAGGQVFVDLWAPDERRLVSYDVGADRWVEWDIPGDLPHMLVGDAERVLFVSNSDENVEQADVVLDVTTGEWSDLPPDPLGASFDRTFTPTPHGLVLTSRELVDNPGAEGPAITRAALYDWDSGRWSRLPDTGQIGGWQWIWTGCRLVAPELGSADGGQIGNWGASYPFGGVIDVPEGEWSPLPGAPDPSVDPWIGSAMGGGRFAAVGGYVYDDREARWTHLPAPRGAAAEPGPAIWAGDRLVVVGGADWSGGEGNRRPETWVYTPPGAREGRP